MQVQLYTEKRALSPNSMTWVDVTKFQLPANHPVARGEDFLARQFYSRFGIDQVNKEGIPRSDGFRFETIHDLDYICKSLGGQEIGRIRRPFSLGNLSEEAVTVYSFGNVYVVNRTSGYHPNRRTTVLVPQEIESKGAPIIARFAQYFGTNPFSIEPEIQQSRKGPTRKTLVRLDG